MIVNPIFISPDAEAPEDAEYAVFAVIYEKEDWDERDAAIRSSNEKRKRPHRLLRLKSKFGYIQNRVPFRLYAIEVDFDCFIITGGAIKIVEEMKQASNTKLELKKLNTLMSELRKVGITSKKSLLDCIYERSSQADIDS